MLTYGTITRDPAKLPEASLQALLTRGFAHLLGNEQASKIVSRIRAAVAEASPKGSDGKSRPVDSVTKDEVRAFRDANPESIAQWTAEAQATVLKDLDSGQVGVRTASGPRVDPVTAVMNAIARAEVTTILKSVTDKFGNPIKIPKGDGQIEFSDGTRTMNQMIANYLRNHGDKVRKDAERRVAEETRKRAKIEAETKAHVKSLGDGQSTSAASLGL